MRSTTALYKYSLCQYPQKIAKMSSDWQGVVGNGLHQATGITARTLGSYSQAKTQSKM
jgi:hypothetical protein